MASSWSRKFAWGIGWILCTLALLVASAELDYRQPQGDLGVALDRSLALHWPPRKPGAPMGSRHWFYSSHLTFNKPVAEIKTGQLWKIARDAYAEMGEEMEQYGISQSDKNTPKAMTVLVFGNEIIIASSQKGRRSFSFMTPSSEATKALNKCQQTWEEDHPGDTKNNRHRRQGRCGEPMAAHLYYTLRGSDANLREENARVGTVVLEGDRLVNKEPCGGKGDDPVDWGCNKFVEEMKLTPLDESAEDEVYDLESLAGGLSKQDQIQLCSSAA